MCVPNITNRPPTIHQLEGVKQELRQKLEQEASGGDSSSRGGGLSELGTDFVPPELSEKITRLERENEALKRQVEEPR